jgi:hypothetical protein
MVEKAGHHFAKVYKISQNRGGTLQSLGAFRASSVLISINQLCEHLAGIGSLSGEEYRYCGFTGDWARFQSWCKRLQERDRLYCGEFPHRELRTDQIITSER